MSDPLLSDPDHRAIWDAISLLRAEIEMNGYGPILRDLARRAKWRANFWAALRKPRQWIARLFWIAVGAFLAAYFLRLLAHP